jgi:hypothetical protein
MPSSVSQTTLCGIFFLCSVAAAQEAQLAAVGKTVLSLRDYAKSHPNVHGAVPDVTLAKHQIRDWIESRLATFPEKGDETTLSNYFRSGISNAKLFCDDDSDCVPTALGFLDEIQVNRDHGLLAITTAVGTGIRCGYDYSGYVYEWKADKWQRVWESEQNDYAEGAYRPQILHSIHLSDAGSDGTRLILTLGTPSGCGGAFVPLYYRVWRTGTPAPSLILDKSETLNDESEPPVIGKLTADDLLIEFSAGGTGYGFTHKALRHFEIHGAMATQTDPIAPTPRDFVEEWLSAPWQDSAARADSPALRDWHAKLHRDDGQGDYPDPALGCANDPSLVEIATHLEGLPKHYFLVRTKQPLRFTMADIGDRPFPNCAQPDPAADKEPSLIPANQ